MTRRGGETENGLSTGNKPLAKRRVWRNLRNTLFIRAGFVAKRLQRRFITMSKEMELTDANFETSVLKSDVPVLVDFWAPWCGPCRMVAPIVEEIAGEYQGKLKVGKLNTDENQQVPAKYGIMSIPTLMIFKDGQVSERIIGAQPKKSITEKINSVLGN
jgi:thioredoxin 1